MSAVARATPADLDTPVAPDAETWRRMSPAERDAFLESSLAALQRQQEAMAEGSPHIRSKIGIREVLGDFFARIGRKIYLGTDLPVHYPGEPVFAPDFLAVCDVEDPGHEDTRMAWVVAEEGRGLDLVIEVLHQGDRRKDLYDNVQFYARLGIQEYFVYDRLRQRLHGYRLPFAEADRYQPIPARGAALSSEVLRLELAIVDERLRFLQPGGSLVPETRELLARANAVLDQIERKVETEAARAEAEALARAEAERRVAELEARVAELERQLREERG